MSYNTHVLKNLNNSISILGGLMKKLLLSCVGLSLFLGLVNGYAIPAKSSVATTVEATFCNQNPGFSSTIALHANGTAEWTQRVYAQGNPPCGIDRQYPTYTAGTYSMNPTGNIMIVNYPGFSYMKGTYAGDSVQSLTLSGDHGMNNEVFKRVQ
jgi:hypothetical protein